MHSAGTTRTGAPLVSGLDLLRWVHPPAIALGADGTMLALNAECRAVVGASAERFLGQTCADVVREQLGDRGVCDATTCASLAHLAGGDGADLERCPLPQLMDARFSTAHRTCALRPTEPQGRDRSSDSCPHSLRS